jgi:hypothetical protein
MKAVSRLILIILCFLWQAVSHLLVAQSTSFLEGKVFNSATSEPVPFATIKLKSNQLSIYSNEDGNFWLIKNSEFQSDSVIITCIGYKKYSLAYTGMYDREVNKIYLTPSQYGSQKVKVTARDGKLNSVSIIRSAISKISTNYPIKPFRNISYYRDYQKTDSNYINLNEANIQTLDSGFNSGSGSNIYRLLAFRKNMDFRRMNNSPVYPVYKVSDSSDNQDKLIPEAVTRDQYSNELLTLMSHDPIRNFKTRSFSFIETFSENFIDNHNFSPPSEVYNDNLLLYKIIFNGKTGIIGDSLLVSGAIYIRPKDYSIHKLEYSCYKNTKGNGLKKAFSLNVEYGYDNTTDSLLRLKYISLSRLFKVIDTDDKSFFRLLSLRWDIISNLNPTLVLSFNNKIDPVTASRKENYTFMVGKREVKMKSIQVAGENLFIRFNNNDVKGMADSCDIYTRVLKDINGNILDKRKSMEIYQYRELFVQEVNIPVSLHDSSIVQYFSPVNDTLSTIRKKEKYRMNLPETR